MCVCVCVCVFVYVCVCVAVRVRVCSYVCTNSITQYHRHTHLNVTPGVTFTWVRVFIRMWHGLDHVIFSDRVRAYISTHTHTHSCIFGDRVRAYIRTHTHTHSCTHTHTYTLTHIVTQPFERHARDHLPVAWSRLSECTNSILQISLIASHLHCANWIFWTSSTRLSALHELDQLNIRTIFSKYHSLSKCHSLICIPRTRSFKHHAHDHLHCMNIIIWMSRI